MNSAEDQVLQEEGTKSPLLFLNRLSGHGPCAAEKGSYTPILVSPIHGSETRTESYTCSWFNMSTLLC